MRTDRQKDKETAVTQVMVDFSQLRETRLKTKSVQSASGLGIKPTTFRTARDSEGVQRPGCTPSLYTEHAELSGDTWSVAEQSGYGDGLICSVQR